MPTESLPEVYKPPPPTQFPTDSNKIPKIPFNFKDNPSTNDGIQVPQIPLSFQIQQGANGWSQYPDTPPILIAIKKIAAKTSGVSESDVTNMRLLKKNRRELLSEFTVIYNITTTPESIGEKTQEFTYYIIGNKLMTSVLNNSFSTELHEFGVLINTTTISFSQYVIYYPPTMSPTSKQYTLTSSGLNNNNDSIMQGIYVGIGALLAVGLICGVGALYLRHKQKLNNYSSNEKSNDISREVSMFKRPVLLAREINPLTDLIPDPLRRIQINHKNEEPDLAITQNKSQ